MGYCWGGPGVLAACELPVAARWPITARASSTIWAEDRAPVLYHFGHATKHPPGD
jgi:hypothetical protein